MPVVKALKVHFVEIHPWPEVLEDFGRPVAVRDEARFQARRARLFENRHCPFAGNERLVVSAHQDFGALA